MKRKLFIPASILCGLCVFFACENEQIIPVYEESTSVEKVSPDRLASGISARKKSDNSNSPTGAVTGNVDGRDFTGNFTVQEFTENGGVLYARGLLTDTKITGKDHKHLEFILEQETYFVPVTIDGTSTAAESFGIMARCTLLNFNFSGLNTNILGLALTIDPIMITINANDDEVLGNLICTALDTLNSVVDLVGILNDILGLLSL
jgi:hypothetical protein